MADTRQFGNPRYRNAEKQTYKAVGQTEATANSPVQEAAEDNTQIAEDAYKKRTPFRGDRGNYRGQSGYNRGYNNFKRGGYSNYRGSNRQRREDREEGEPESEVTRETNYNRNYENRGGYRGEGGNRNFRNKVEYHSNEGEAEDEYSEVELTEAELTVLNLKKNEWKDSLKGVVTEAAIDRKIISLDFDEEKIDKWANSLIQKDSRVKGLQVFEWNDTETRQEKKNRRMQEAQELKLKRERQQRRAEIIR
jgi:hypothetical protein